MQTSFQRHFRVSGLLTLRDGITLRGGSNAGGVEILADAAFMMQEGSVIENCRWSVAGTFGGGVSMNGTNATFSLAGGIVRNNSAFAGGGVAMLAHENMTVHMSSGSIEGNTANHSGGGVAMNASNTSTFTMTGGTIANNTATQGGGVHVGATTVGAFTMLGGSIEGNTATGNGGAIFSSRFSGLEDVPSTAWNNLRIGEHAVFVGNRAEFTSAPPNNAATLDHIQFAQASRQGHILNNRDVNYTANEVPDYQITFHFDADNRGRAGMPLEVEVTPDEALTLPFLAKRFVPVNHIFSTAEEPGLALWGWFREAELTQVRQGRNRPPVGAEGFLNLTADTVITQAMINTYFDENDNLDLHIIWSLWGDADDNGVVDDFDIILINQWLHDQELISWGQPTRFNNPINLSAANVTVSGTVSSLDTALLTNWRHDQDLIAWGSPPRFNAILGAAPAGLGRGAFRAEFSQQNWFTDAMELMLESETTLSLEEKASRATALSMLHQLLGAPDVAFGDLFGDVPPDQWANAAATWIDESGLAYWDTNGTVLHRFAELMG